MRSLTTRYQTIPLAFLIMAVLTLASGSTAVVAAQTHGPEAPVPHTAGPVPVPLGPPTAVAGSGSDQGPPAPFAPALNVSFDGLNFGNSGFIPPDPIAAAGPNQVVSVINVNIQWRDKDGTNTTSQTLANFFTSLSPANATFDPKVIYDQHAGRFVVVTLERVDASPPANPSASNTSRILVAVSDDSNPNGTWYFQAFNSKLNLGAPPGTDYWADYPGLGVDGSAVYITANFFTFPGVASAFGGSRLWILNKTSPAGGLYGGGTSTITVHDPASSTGALTAFTLQPAHIFGTPPATVGTWLVAYNALTNGTLEFLQTIRVDTPLGTPAFTLVYPVLGDLEANSVTPPNPVIPTFLPDAPQASNANDIEVNDRRALNAVWRNNSLWTTFEIYPGSGPDLNQVTAHWVEVDTSTLGSLTVNDQGNAGGEDIATGAYTYYPSIAVDGCGNMALGMALSSSTVDAGAYYVNRYASDAAGTLQPTGTLAAGLGGYARFDSVGRNRWGDYSGIALDPATEASFWVYNEYAGTTNNWLTRYGQFASGIDFGDLPGTYPVTAANNGARHCIGGPYLGSNAPDPDVDGQASAMGFGDGSDEDGVGRRDGASGNGWSNGTVASGEGGRVDIIITGGSATPQFFLDFGSGLTAVTLRNASGTPLSLPLAAGTHAAYFDIPAGTFTSLGPEGSVTIPGRMRLSTAGGLTTTGLATDGEVEDYVFSFTPTNITQSAVSVTTTTAASTLILAAYALLLLLTAAGLRRNN